MQANDGQSVFDFGRSTMDGATFSERFKEKWPEDTGGLLYLYGPYRFDGACTAPSNQDFDRSLRARDPAWGVRDVGDLSTAAAAAGFMLHAVVAMPANNHSLVYRRAP